MLELELEWNRPNLTNCNVEEERMLSVRLLTSSENRGLPVHIAVALDTSESMRTNSKLSNAQAACRSVISSLREMDRFSLAGFSDAVRPLFEFGQSSNLEPSAVDGLEASGVTRTDLALDWLRSTLSRSEHLPVAVLVTDGYSTDAKGKQLDADALERIRKTAEALRRTGVLTCATGVGAEADFNVGFLNSLGDFLYAADVGTLGDLLASYLVRAQSITAGVLVVTLEPCMPHLSILEACQIAPSHRPLELAAEKNQLKLRLPGLASGTELLARVSVRGQKGFARTTGPKEALAVSVSDPQGSEHVRRTISINYVGSRREASAVNEAVARAERTWDSVRINDQLLQDNGPLRTAELLSEMIQLAKKMHDDHLLTNATQQLDTLRKTGDIDRGLVAAITADVRTNSGFGRDPVPRPRRRLVKDPTRATLRKMETAEVLPLFSASIQIGRGDDVDLDLTPFETQAQQVSSRRHAELRWNAGTLEIVDRGSKNGTYVNGERILPPTPRALYVGDLLSFGNLTFCLEEAVT